MRLQKICCLANRRQITPDELLDFGRSRNRQIAAGNRRRIPNRACGLTHRSAGANAPATYSGLRAWPAPPEVSPLFLTVSENSWIIIEPFALYPLENGVHTRMHTPDGTIHTIATNGSFRALWSGGSVTCLSDAELIE